MERSLPRKAERSGRRRKSGSKSPVFRLLLGCAGTDCCVAGPRLHVIDLRIHGDAGRNSDPQSVDRLGPTRRLCRRVGAGLCLLCHDLGVAFSGWPRMPPSSDAAPAHDVHFDATAHASTEPSEKARLCKRGENRSALEAYDAAAVDFEPTDRRVCPATRGCGIHITSTMPGYSPLIDAVWVCGPA